jgi:hypothetical protein
VAEDEAVGEVAAVELWVAAVADVLRLWEAKFQGASSCIVATVHCLPKHEEAFEVGWLKS